MTLNKNAMLAKNKSKRTTKNEITKKRIQKGNPTGRGSSKAETKEDLNIVSGREKNGK